MTVDVFPGAGVVEAEFMGRDANNVAVLLVQFADHVCVCASPHVGDHGNLRDSIKLRTRVVP
jgi:hypothetical protein